MVIRRQVVPPSVVSDSGVRYLRGRSQALLQDPLFQLLKLRFVDHTTVPQLGESGQLLGDTGQAVLDFPVYGCT